jgi:membrane-associated phospholipid phosphatase
MDAAHTKPAVSSGARPKTRVIAIFGLAFFVLLSVLVQMRLLVGPDEAFMQAKQQLTSNLFYAWSQGVAIVVSAEFSLIYAAAGAWLLWRAGMGIRSLAPATFVLAVPVEVVMKLFLQQPPVPSQFKHAFNYPLTSVNLHGSFPSGHAMRSGFFCVFLAILLWQRGGLAARAAAIGFLALALAFGFARVYMGDHWLSDVVAGLALGASMALLVAPPVAERLNGASK